MSEKRRRRPPGITGIGKLRAPPHTTELHVEVKSNLWFTWSTIAISHEAEARRHRAAWTVTQKGESLLGEYHASLVTIVAVTSAFDALHAELAPLLDRRVDDFGAKQWTRLRDTFAAACKPPARWQNEFASLFRVLRPAAVHSRPEQHQPIYHPGLRTSIALENHRFSAETSTGGVDLLMGVLEALLGDGAVIDQRLTQWALRQKVLEPLRSERSELTTGLTN